MVHLTITEETLPPFELCCHPRPSIGTPRNCGLGKAVCGGNQVPRIFERRAREHGQDFALDSYSGVGPFARMVFDASGGGVGGLLVVDGKVVFRFATNVDEVDEKAVGM